MEEIEVGEYVRTKSGYVAKIKQYLKNTGTYLFDDFIQDIDNCKYRCISDNEFKKVVTKHSKNIIDLIEVGDFVNGELVREPIDKENGYNSDYTGFQQFLNAYGEIKSILTHEQYEDNCYILEKEGNMERR